MTNAMGRLPRSAVLGFALGSLGSGVYSTVPTVLLLYYCTEILRLSPVVAATIVFVPKAWAIFWDPVVGAWSDRHQSARGRRAPFILGGTLGVSVSFALLFNAPVAGDIQTIAFVMLVYFAMASAYSLFAVPYVAIPAEASPIAAERERLMTWRMVFAMLGVLVGAGLAPHLVALAGGGRHGYGIMAFIIAAACGVAMFVTFLTVRDFPGNAVPATAGPRPARGGIRRVLGNRDYLRLWICYVLMMSGASLFTAMVPYFVTRVLGRSEGDSGTALLALLVSTIVSLPLWAKAQRHWGGWRLMVLAVIGYGIVAGAFALLPHGMALARAVPLFFVLGVPFAGLQLLPFTLLAHVAHADAQSGLRQEGLYTGIWTAGEKLALAIGPAAAGAGLALSGYVSGAAQQSDASLAGLQSVMSFGPALFLLPCLVLLTRRRSAILARDCI